MQTARPHLIIVQGAPGVGKTRLARRIANEFSWQLISKDDFKEALYEKWGVPTADDTKLYGKVAIRAMYIAAEEYLKSGRTVLIEAPLEARFAIGGIAAIAPGCEYDVLQLHVYCNPEVQVARFHQRIENNSRHIGHVDSVDFSLEDAIEAQERNQALPDFITISIYTTEFNDAEYTDVCNKIKEKI
jgi:predicted kinase